MNNKLRIEKYERNKHQKKLISYLEKLERRFEHVPYIFPVDIIEMLCAFKDIFVVLENNSVVTLGFRNNIKKNVGFFFEKPITDFDFLKDFDSVAIYFPPKQEVDSIKCEEVIETSEAIIDLNEVVGLSGKKFKTLRSKINKFRKENPNMTSSPH